MAILRCVVHGKTDGEAYVTAYGWPSQDLRCGLNGCRESAAVWLDPEELRAYERGTRLFWTTGTFATIRIDGRAVQSVDASMVLTESSFDGSWPSRGIGRRASRRRSR